MIFAFDIKMEPGTVHTPDRFTDTEGNWHEGQPFYIVREATYEEYLEQTTNNGATPHPPNLRGFFFTTK